MRNTLQKSGQNWLVSMLLSYVLVAVCITAHAQPTVTGNRTINSGGTTTLTASGATGNQLYKWYDASMTIVNGGPTFTTPVLTSSTTYYVCITNYMFTNDGPLTTVQITVINASPIPITITAFTPTTGGIGTTVTINGAGFNATLGNNVVFFGATRATVIAATTTALSVKVPVGATYQPISVTNLTTGLTAYSAKPFVTTFWGGGFLGTAIFAAKVDFGVRISEPISISVGDLDGDGKPDLAIMGSYCLTVLRNNCRKDTVSFVEDGSPALILNTFMKILRICDLDGDGKLDLVARIDNVIRDGGPELVVFRNTSSIGKISFESKEYSINCNIDVITGNAGLATGDLDGDGKPDLVVLNSLSNTLSVFRNTSNIGAISFDAMVDFSTGRRPNGISIGDLDTDGKVDLAVTNEYDNTVSVFRNMIIVLYT